MKYKFFYSLLLLMVSSTIYSQEKVTLSGTISDSENSETLFGVNVYFPEANVGATTNEYGFYSITLPKGEYTMYISYLGFATITEKNSCDKEHPKRLFTLSRK